MKISLLLPLAWLAVAPTFAQTSDTVRHIAPGNKLVYYRNPAIDMQVARFDLAAPVYIREFALMVGGEAGGGARLRLFGREGGGMVPALERDLIPPITVAKIGPGIERITVRLPEPVLAADNQFFVALDRFSGGLELLSNSSPVAPACTSRNGDFYSQYVRISGGGWRSCPYAFAMDLVLEPAEKLSPRYLADVTVDAAVADTVSACRSIAWADLNDDGWLEMLAGGRLYLNNRDETFRDITLSAGLSGEPAAHLFADIDNDGAVDILFLADAGMNGSGVTLYRNEGDLRFRGTIVDLPALRRPTGASLADVNGDGRLDLFVGQADSDGIGPLRDLLLINNGSLGFADSTRLLGPPPAGYSGSLGSEWVDFNNDGRLDLFATSAGSARDRFWRNNGDGTFTDIGLEGRSPDDAGRPGAGRGCDWSDYDNDGDIDLLLPEAIAPGRFMEDAPVHVNGGSPYYDMSNSDGVARLSYEEKRAGGSWGDVDNDGLLDLILTTSCDCRFADLYVQTPDHRLARKTFEYGLHGVAAGGDAVWVDYNNDGLLDLSTFEGGRFRLYRNNGPFAGNSITFDLSGAAGGQVVGSRVTAHVGAVRYTREVTSGRGLLMQDPLRLLFGLGDAGAVDSVTVRWANGGGTETFAGMRSNTIYKLQQGGSRFVAAGAAVGLQLHPNPFTTDLSITYDLPVGGHVSLEIHTAAGRRLATLIDETRPAGRHVITWSARDEEGNRLPPGIYIYRFVNGSTTLTGRAVLVH